MKKIILIMALFSAVTFYGQQKVAIRVQELLSSKTTFKPVAPLAVAANFNSASISAVVDKATFATINDAVVKDVAVNKYKAIELTIPYNGSTVTMQLYRAEVTAKGFHIDTDKSKDIDYTAGAYYRGIIKGDPASIASFSFFEREMNGVVSSGQLHNLVVGRLKDTNAFNRYIIYSDIELNVNSTFGCGVTEGVFPHFEPHGRSAQSTESEHCVTLYFELDHDLFLQNGSDTALTSNWITSVFNNAQTLYENDGITTAIKSVFIWTEQDPYSGTSSTDYLEEFYTMRPVFDGDAGQLLGIDDGGLGGVAISIGGLCSDGNVSYGDIDLWYDTVPMFSWTVEVVTHELGHLFGSPHTHGCYWNGDNTAIDGCGTSAGYVEGDCPIGPIPSSEVQGTIMSYCHLIGDVGINFANGFGPQPAQRILDHIAASSCLSTDCINTCINTIAAVTLQDADMTQATLSWTDIGSGPWEVSYATLTGTFSNWVQAATTSYTVTGLTANTYYRFRVRPVCGEGMQPQSTPLFFGTAADWCNGATFTDTGGDNNYPNNQHLIRIIKPAAAGQQAVVTFNSFSTEYGYDFMYVYDGTGTAAPLLGTYSNSISSIFESTAPDGALTFEFISDEFSTASGWSAAVSCTLGTDEHAISRLTYYPNPTNGLVNITSPDGISGIEVYNVAGQLLLKKEVNGTAVVADISGFAGGVYFFNIASGPKRGTFRVVKQ